MGDTTDISWADKTFNPWIGCTNISPACDHCYAESLAKRWSWVEWGPGKARKRTSEANWRKPLVWDRQAAANETRPRVFCASLADWADSEVSEDWREDLFHLIASTPHLEWLLLSKRHALVRGFLLRYAKGLKNIRIGMTVENDDFAKLRLSRLHMIKQDGYPTFVSYEPALGPVDWDRWLDRTRIEGCVDWLIAGGESGRGYRAPTVKWFQDARDACRKHGVPFHFKQWGGVATGAVLDGSEHFEFPASIGG
jgi:protein gp37